MKTSRDFIGDKKPKEGTINPRSLSDKRVEADNKKKDNGFCWEKDVKEAVKELKDAMKNKKVNTKIIFEKPHIMFDLMLEEIDKIFGKELVE